MDHKGTTGKKVKDNNRLYYKIFTKIHKIDQNKDKVKIERHNHRTYYHVSIMDWSSEGITYKIKQINECPSSEYQ